MSISGILSGKMIFDYSRTHLTFFQQIPLAWYGWSRWYHCCINGFNCCYNCLLESRSVFKFKDWTTTTTDTGIVSADFVCEIVTRLCVHKNKKKYWQISKGPVTLCNFSCNLQRSSTRLKRCKFVANVWHVKNILVNCDGNIILHLSILELHCKLQEKLHRVTAP